MKVGKLKRLHTLRSLDLPVPKFTHLPDLRATNSDIFSVQGRTTLRRALSKAIAELGHTPNGISIRSASSDEDTAQVSSAGRYLSFNGLKDIDEACNAALTIWQQHQRLAPVGVTCQLIVQTTHCCYFGGVLFRDSSAEEPTVVIESYYGSCRSVVDGLTLPYRSSLSRGQWTHQYGSAALCTRFAAHKGLFRTHYDAVPVGALLSPRFEPFPRQVRLFRRVDNLAELEVYGYRPSYPPAWYFEKICQPLAEIAETLDTGSGVDLEWGCSEEGILALYQVRPLTLPLRSVLTLADHDLDKQRETSPVASRQYWGLPASPGRARGRVTTSMQSAGEDAIVMMREAQVSDVRAVESSSGVVSALGGVLSHIAIVCREVKIPCVAGIQVLLPMDTLVEIDGDLGVVTLIED